MRNVAIGAVLGFVVVVLLLSVFNQEPPPLTVAPTVADAGMATTLQPVNAAPIVKGGALMARDPAMRRMLMEKFQELPQPQMGPAPDAGS